ncbi:(pine wood nematode) hypothetical protein [Aphelenchoides fujianensis]|nr:(pine wood nematode) hypothetical protein [Aphelenchoides fujianensis]
MFLLLLGVLLVAGLVHQFWWRRRGLPPGPLPFPLIGNALGFLTKERFEDQFFKWKQEHGDVYTIFLGPEPIVTVNDYDLMQAGFIGAIWKQPAMISGANGDDYADRAAMEAFDIATRGGIYGVIDTSGEIWREQRRFSLKVLRDFGLSKNRMEERVLEEFQTIFENINKDISAGVVEHDFHRHTGDVINVLVNGYRFTTEGHQKEFYDLKDVTEEMMKSFADPFLNIAATSKTVAKLPIFRDRLAAAGRRFKKIFDYLDGIIEEHLKLNDYSNDSFEPQDYVDAWLLEARKQEAAHGTNHHYTRIQLVNMCFDLWFAGQETTSATMTWALAFLIRHPEVQQKMHEELDRVIGSDRLITMSDKTDLPYVQAVIMEVQRTANIVGQNVPRRTTREVEVAGCRLPKGTAIVPQVSVLMIDPKHFPEPKRFNPDRFIDANGKLKRADHLIPFSLGKRQCLGEGLARMELFLFFLPGKEPPTLRKQNGGASLGTASYRCRVERRHQ